MHALKKKIHYAHAQRGGTIIIILQWRIDHLKNLPTQHCNVKYDTVMPNDGKCTLIQLPGLDFLQLAILELKAQNYSC